MGADFWKKVEKYLRKLLTPKSDCRLFQRSTQLHPPPLESNTLQTENNHNGTKWNAVLLFSSNMNNVFEN